MLHTSLTMLESSTDVVPFGNNVGALTVKVVQLDNYVGEFLRCSKLQHDCERVTPTVRAYGT